MAMADTFKGFFDGMSNTGSSDPFFNLLSGGFAGLENAWKGMTGQSSNEKINAENIAFQQKNLDYQMALQQQIFDREDTSYQRTVADMYKAGLSPLSMKSTNGSGSVVPTQAPQKQFESVNAVPLITQALAEINSLSIGQAQRDNINAQTRKLELENQMMSETYDDRKIGEFARQRSSYLDWKRSQRDYEFEHVTGQYGSQFFQDINKMRIATGKKPFHYNPFLFRDGSESHTDYSFDFNEMVDFSRFALTSDLLSNVADFISNNPLSDMQKKGKNKLDKQKVLGK